MSIYCTYIVHSKGKWEKGLCPVQDDATADIGRVIAICDK